MTMTNGLNRVVFQLCHAARLQETADLSDGVLLERYVLTRDQAAFEALLRRHGAMVLGVCRRVLRNEHDAEDAYQAVFLVLACKAAWVRPRGMVGNWLHGVAHKTALKARAMKQRRQQKEEHAGAVPKRQAADEVWQEALSLLDAELAHLPDKYRAAIVLCDLEGKTIRMAARDLGCPQGTLAARLTRGRALLARRLTRHGVRLSVGTVATALGHGAAQASLPAELLLSTLKAASLWATGQAVAAGAITVAVATLTEVVLKTMLLTKLKNTAVALLVVFFLMAGAAAVIPRTSAGEQPDPSALEKGEAKIKTRWEYKALSHDEIKALEFNKRGTDTAEGGLNMLGDEGWELVAIEPPVPRPAPPFGGKPALYVFKRQKK
jgi:RNA polymerase sigma factor (sigma-70 family)